MIANAPLVPWNKSPCLSPLITTQVYIHSKRYPIPREIEQITWGKKKGATTFILQIMSRRSEKWLPVEGQE